MKPLSIMNDFFFNDLDYVTGYGLTEEAIKNDKSNSVIYLDVPGVKKEDIKMTLDGRTLTVEFERKDHFKNRGRKTYTLSSKTDVDNIESTLEDGVLKIKLPLLATAQPKTLQIK